MPNRKDVLTTGEVARICHVAPRTVSKWFDSGKLRGYRIPGSRDRRIPLPKLVAFMQEHGMPLDGLDLGETRVLFVGPNDYAPIVKALERRGGYSVRIAATSFDAGVAAQQFAPQVIVVDLDNPDDAAEITEAVKHNEELASTCVLWATEPSADAPHYPELFDATVPRPLRPKAFLEAVESAAAAL